MEDRRERFFMTMFIVGYVGLFVCIFFWEMTGTSWLCRASGLHFRPALAFLTLVSIVVYCARTRIFSVIDGFTAAGVLAASLSTFFMGGGSGLWLLELRFVIDLCIMTVLLLIMLFIVFIHSRRKLMEMAADEEADERKEK